MGESHNHQRSKQKTLIWSDIYQVVGYRYVKFFT